MASNIKLTILNFSLFAKFVTDLPIDHFFKPWSKFSWIFLFFETLCHFVNISVFRKKSSDKLKNHVINFLMLSGDCLVVGSIGVDYGARSLRSKIARGYTSPRTVSDPTKLRRSTGHLAAAPNYLI